MIEQILVGLGINLVLLMITYLLGSINIALLISRIVFKDDIRKYGSGNAGATNMLRRFGVKIGFLIFVADILKVYFVSLIIFAINSALNQNNPFYTQWVVEDLSYYTLYPQVAAFGMIIGHIYPIFFKFKGGKGAAALVGFLLTINFVFFIFGALVFLAFLFWRKIVSLATISAISLLVPLAFIPLLAALPLGFLAIRALWYLNGIFYFFSAFLIIFKHRDNIQRLLKKEEKTISAFFKRKSTL